MRCCSRFLLSLLFLLLAGLQLGAQRYYKPYHLFTIRDGLAQQQVRAFFEDSRGYIWIGANAGITRFDGHSLHAYAAAQGFIAKPVYSFREAPDGAIWYRSADTVYRFDGRAAAALPMTPEFWSDQPPYLWPLITLDINRLLGDRYPVLRSLDEHYGLFIDSAGAAIVIDWSKRLCHRLLQGCSTTPLPPGFPAFGQVDPTDRFMACQDACYAWTAQGLQCVARYLPGKDSAVVLHPLAPDIFNYNNHRQNKYWYRDGPLYRPIELARFNRLDKLMLDRQRRIHIATDEGYAVLYPDGPERLDLPQAAYPWSILPDDQGRIWVGSNRDGILCLEPGRKPRVFPLPADDNEHQIFPGKLKGPNGTLLFGGYKGFYRMLGGKAVLFRLGEPIEALCWDPVRHRYLAAGTRLYCVNESLDQILETIALPPKLLQGYGLSDLDMAPDGSIWACGRGGVLQLDGSGMEKAFWAAPGRSNCLWIDPAGACWLGADKGLLRLDALAHSFVSATSFFSRYPVNNLVPLPGRQLAVVTDAELLLLDISSAEHPVLKNYWAEKNGFQLLEAIDNGAAFDGHYLWIPSGTGIQRIRLSSAAQSLRSKPSLRIDQLNAERMAFGQTAPLQPVQGNAVDVELSLIDLTAGSFRVAYQLNEGLWQEAGATPLVHVPGLKDGFNTLQFRVEIPTMDPADWPTASAQVMAVLPWWQRAFVRWLLYLSALVVVLVTAYLIYKSRKEKQLRALLDQTQLATVQAQLNPHILFNLLSSLQNSITNRSKTEASHHLVQIARLIREVLEFSFISNERSGFNFPTITLDQEIQFLQNYLELESMQHSPPFQFEIQCEGLDDREELVLPPLLIQPLVENAVIHGIKRNPGKDGRVRILFREEGRQLVITVADNGPGLSAGSSAQAPLFRYRSRGGELLQKRLNLMGKLGFPAHLSLQPGSEGGTIAEIRIQKMICVRS